jgi:hypothetical protein
MFEPNKAFDEASSRGQAPTLGDGVAYAENQVREALAAIKETGRSEPKTLVILQQGRMSVVGKSGLRGNVPLWRKADVQLSKTISARIFNKIQQRAAEIVLSRVDMTDRRCVIVAA